MLFVLLGQLMASSWLDLFVKLDDDGVQFPQIAGDLSNELVESHADATPLPLA